MDLSVSTAKELTAIPNAIADKRYPKAIDGEFLNDDARV